MLQEVLDLLPDAVHRMPQNLALGLTAGGFVLALVGARLSRSLLTLGLVAGGTVLGLHLPKWFGWGIDPMGPAFGTAIVLGLSGFMLTLVWEGLLLGSLSALIAGTAVWMTLAPGVHWEKPQVDWSATAVEIALKLWSSLPMEISRPFPIAVLVGFGLGFFLLVLWPRMGRLLLYAMLGIGLFVICGSLAMTHSNPDWVHSITQDSKVQVACMGWMVLLSILVQWLLLPREKKKRSVEGTSEKLPGDTTAKAVRPAKKDASAEIPPASPGPKIAIKPSPAPTSSNSNQVKPLR